MQLLQPLKRPARARNRAGHSTWCFRMPEAEPGDHIIMQKQLLHRLHQQNANGTAPKRSWHTPSWGTEDNSDVEGQTEPNQHYKPWQRAGSPQCWGDRQVGHVQGPKAWPELTRIPGATLCVRVCGLGLADSSQGQSSTSRDRSSSCSSDLRGLWSHTRPPWGPQEHHSNQRAFHSMVMATAMWL